MLWSQVHMSKQLSVSGHVQGQRFGVQDVFGICLVMSKAKGSVFKTVFGGPGLVMIQFIEPRLSAPPDEARSMGASVAPLDTLNRPWSLKPVVISLSWCAQGHFVINSLVNADE